MKKRILLNTERMKGKGPYLLENFQVNYLYGLNELCEKYVDKNFTILELGSNDGVSSSLFSYYAKKVVCVDMNKTNKMNEVLLNNDNIIFFNMKFDDFYEMDGDNKYDLIYIDGDHTHSSVSHDINKFKNKVKNSGFIAGHDYNSETPGVKSAVLENFSENNIEIFSDSSWIIKIN